MKSSFFTKNTNFLRQKVKKYWDSSHKWLVNTPERALEEAYQAAQIIKNIELEHFGNQKISPESVNYTDNVMSYWQVYLNKNLTIIKAKLAEFRLARSITNTSNPVFLEKLNFIDEVIAKYSQDEAVDAQHQLAYPQTSSTIAPIEPLQIKRDEMKKQPNSSNIDANKVQPVMKKTGFLPRSIGRTFNKIKSDFNPQSEQQFVKDYRVSRNRTRTAVKFLAMLVLVPLLTQILSKQLIISPILERVRGENTPEIFLNSEMEEEALQELKIFERELRFNNLIHEAPLLSSEAIEEKVKNKALELAEEFIGKSNNAISNVFADLISLIAFGVVIATSKREIVIVKSFMDEIVYGLSDSAKAFLIILFTDIFVGFHSPHGWEVILEGLSEHLGLPANRSAIFLFIATFPVILDTIFKYWIFRYLSRLSPSALATLKEMDE
ncbi:proton extrusion protein PcxA [Hassallia byssoidea VB512170]|uniref:Proton extrusion protein PxcA n=1 Tax=Hassallia byssoidea VB512170 TaxID=1304833 RepID=A0A846HB34_9CYAN|nr:proton extrusion protein PcxA [Hassalia byssoidea]NEU73651.1 proton extrusion protein PcxA [Hassalia byssoidea VB512170]